MPTVAETSQVKRLITDLLTAPDGEDGSSSSKRQRVHFDDNVEVLSSDNSYEENPSEEHEEDVDFFLSIGDDGDWDYTITNEAIQVPLSALSEDHKLKTTMTDPSLCKISRPTSPFAGCDRQLCEELHMMCTSTNESKSCCDEAVEKEASLLRVSSSNSLGNNLTISLKACNCNDSRPAIMPISLITPPSSPRRIRTMSYDGREEEVTICEWPCNLTVDNAITSALESAPLSLPLGSGCYGRELSIKPFVE